jgi:hypothetical protein
MKKQYIIKDKLWNKLSVILLAIKLYVYILKKKYYF